MIQPRYNRPQRDPNQPFDPSKTAELLIAAGGDLELAASRAGFGRDVEGFIASISNRNLSEEIARAARVLTMLSQVRMLFLAETTLANKIEDISMIELSKLYRTLAQNVAELSDPHETNVNVNTNPEKVLMDLLVKEQPELVEALGVLGLAKKNGAEK